MSDPTSVQRAPSCCCCCCQRRCRRHRDNHCCRRHHRRRRRRSASATTAAAADDESSDRRAEQQCYSSTTLPSLCCRDVNNGDVTTRLAEAKKQEIRWNNCNQEKEERDEDRVSVDRATEVDEPSHVFSTVETVAAVAIERDEEAKQQQQKQQKQQRSGGRGAERRLEDRENEDPRLIARCSLQVDCRGLPRQQQQQRQQQQRQQYQQQQQCRRNGGRGWAANVFLLATASAFFALAVVLPPVSGTSSEKDEAARTRMGGTGTGTALAEAPPSARGAERVPLVDTRTTTSSSSSSSSSSSISSSSSDGELTGSIDLLAALQLYNTTRTGVTQVPGLARLKPAYYLQGEERDLRLNEASFERAAALLRRVPEFTVAAALRQEEANSGTIVAFSHGNNRYLELQSSGRKDELRLHYVSRRDGAVHVEAFPFRLADGAWHRLALSISGSQVELLVDCHPLYRRLLRPGPPDTNFTLPQLQLWVGQRNAKHFLFKGALQDVKLIPGAHGYLSQCPQLDSSCPTCGQFSILQNTVEQLMHNLNELTRRLAAAEGRISKVEECECQKSCRTNGTVHEDGATWEKGCEQCSCVHGDIECRPTPCAPVTCKHPVIPPGQCCPVCLKQCYLHGVIYDHGEKVSPKQCVECDCFDGSFTCQRFDTETRCPPLPCPPNEQISVAEECCKFCPGVDYCAKGHECHVNASCLNLQTTYACHCNIGFQGDGHKCHDVDECKQQGGSEGHHCNANTRCVNVVGSYTCECLPGYHRIDKFNCAELDECATGRHSCAEHATCINTAGSYYCVCKDGYDGDGYTCKPKCEQSCQNGGECVSPGRCSCRRGYIGNSCELDLDECASDLHRCHHSSTCFNMPGWYYCRCKPGYRSALHESNQGTQCLDIDECNDQTIERRHTCHPSARCVNTEGGYECACPQEDENQRSLHESSSSSSSSSLAVDSNCRLSCWYEGREVANGDSLAPAGNPCRRCTCKDGVITCREPICDCSAPGSRRDKCCPQCDPAASCRHQELHHLVFRSGDRWIYQCQTCECLYGEIDCWQMECPPVTCPNPVTEDGDCCPRCEDDPCARELPGVAATNGSSAALLSPSAGRPQPCSYAGLLHESGSSWQNLHDKCTTCECKDGQLCCSYDYRCAGDLEDKRQSPVAPGSSGPGGLSRGADAVRQNFDSSEATLPTALPELAELVSSSSSISSINSNNRIRARPSATRTTTNGLFPSGPIASSSDSSVTDEAIAPSLLRLPLSPDTTGLYASDNESEARERGTTSTGSSPRAEGERAALSSPAPSSPSSPTPKTPASLGAGGSPAGAAKTFTAFNDIQTARYSTSNLNDRKTGFAAASVGRRRGERGPRLINGNPNGGHDAT